MLKTPTQGGSSFPPLRLLVFLRVNGQPGAPKDRWELKSSPASSNPALGLSTAREFTLKTSPGGLNPALGAQIQPWRLKSSPGNSNPTLGAQIQFNASFCWSLDDSNPEDEAGVGGMPRRVKPFRSPKGAEELLIMS